jgi:hypothetical protein
MLDRSVHDASLPIPQLSLSLPSLTMNDSTTILFAIWLVVLSIWLYVQLGKKSPQVPLPPGPKGLPLLGNLMDLPRLQPFVTFAKWGEIYGVSSYFNSCSLH